MHPDLIALGSVRFRVPSSPEFGRDVESSGHWVSLHFPGRAIGSLDLVWTWGIYSRWSPRIALVSILMRTRIALQHVMKQHMMRVTHVIQDTDLGFAVPWPWPGLLSPEHCPGVLFSPPLGGAAQRAPHIILASASWEKQPVKRIAACQQIRRNGMQHANSKMHLRSLAPKKICRQSICQQFPPACERLPKSIFGMCNMQYAHGMCAGHVRRALLPLPSALSLPQLALRLNACPQREPQRERE